jgi:hypothetical protein
MNVEARTAIRRLRAGIVPTTSLASLSVGYDEPKADITRTLTGMRNGHSPLPLFVRGEWGTGKTHFLTFLRSAAHHAGVPSAKVDLNARISALNYPQRLYPVIAEQLKLHKRLGLHEVLRALLNDVSKRTRLISFANSRPASPVKRSLRLILGRFEDGACVELLDDPAWFVLTGGDLAWADYAYKRNDALERLASLAQMLKAVSLGGLVIVFDEAETVDQLWNIRSRLGAYSVLGQLCRIPGVWCVFGITARFDRTLAADLDRIRSEGMSVGADADWFLRGWARGEFRTLLPPTVDHTNVTQLARAIERLYRVAYPSVTVDDKLIRRCVQEWIQNPSQNPRRLIRRLVHCLDIMRPI